MLKILKIFNIIIIFIYIFGVEKINSKLAKKSTNEQFAMLKTFYIY